MVGRHDSGSLKVKTCLRSQSTVFMDAVLLPKTHMKYKSFVDLVVFSNMFVLHKRSVSRVLFNSSSYIIPRVYPLKPAFSFSANTSARR